MTSRVAPDLSNVRENGNAAGHIPVAFDARFRLRHAGCWPSGTEPDAGDDLDSVFTCLIVYRSKLLIYDCSRAESPALMQIGGEGAAKETA